MNRETRHVSNVNTNLQHHHSFSFYSRYRMLVVQHACRLSTRQGTRGKRQEDDA